MANRQLTEEDWLELYRYLLQRLQERELDELRVEIEAAASAPLLEESTPEDDLRVSQFIRGEVGKAVVRRKRPQEVFTAAIEVLETRIVELPAIASAISSRLARSSDEIEFRVDYEEQYAPTQSEPVVLSRLAPDIHEQQTISNLLSLLTADRKRLKVG